MAGPSARLKRAAPGPGLEDKTLPPDRAVKRPCISNPQKPPHYYVNKHVLASLGGGWVNTPPFSGDEDRLYRWVAEPALWARVIGHDLEQRTQQRIIGLHAGLHDGIDASGFVLWRSFPAARPTVTMTIKSTTSPGQKIPQRLRLALPKVAIKQSKLPPSSRFGAGWETLAHAGPPSSPGAGPAWLRAAWSLIQRATFPFLNAPMPVVDANWANDRFARTDAVTHALIEVGSSSSTSSAPSSGDEAEVAEASSRGKAVVKKSGGGGFAESVKQWVTGRGRGGSSSSSAGGGSSSGSSSKADRNAPNVVAAALETPFPAERLLRSLVCAGKDDDVLYIDAIVADRYGAAYRLLCDMVAERQARNPDRRLVVVLMAVVSSDVLGRYARWGFSYGGVVPAADGESSPPLLVDRIDKLHTELKHFEQAMTRPAPAPSPTSVVNETI